MPKIKPMYLFSLVTTLFLLIIAVVFSAGNLSLQKKPEVEPGLLSISSHSVSNPTTIPTATLTIQSDQLTYKSPTDTSGLNFTLQYPKLYDPSYGSSNSRCSLGGKFLCLNFPQDVFPDPTYQSTSFHFWLPDKCKVIENPKSKVIGKYLYTIEQETPRNTYNGFTSRDFTYQYQGPLGTCFVGNIYTWEKTDQPLNPSQIQSIASDFEKILQTVTIDFNSIPTSAPTEYNIYKNALDTEQGWKTTSVGTPSLDQCDGHQSQKTTDYLKSFDDKKINWYEKNIGDFEFKSVTGKFGEYHQGITVLYTPNTLGFTNSQELNDFNKCVSGVGEAHPLVATKDRIYWSFVCTGGMGPDDPIDQKNFEDYTKKCEEAYKTVSIIFSGVDNPIPPTSQ